MKIAQINNYNYSRNNNYQTLAVKKQNEQSPNTTALQNQYNQPSFGKELSRKGAVLIGIFFIISGILLRCLDSYCDNERYRLEQENKELDKRIDSALTVQKELKKDLDSAIHMDSIRIQSNINKIKR